VLNLGNKKPLKAGSLVLSIVVCMSVLLATGGHTAAVSAQAAAPASLTTVAKNPLGMAQSAFTGTTASGKSVTGNFTPLRFVTRNGNLKARGLLRGVVRQAGTNTTFAVIRTLPVRRVNGSSVSNAREAAAAAAVCPILRLRLGPIRLNLLGLRITTNRIRLNIVAVPGPGNLLGNLLCAIAGLLDGPPTPAQLILARRQLNRLLGLLNLGL
jgi:hypothetical protein